MTREEIIEAIVTEAKRAEAILQDWPCDPVHAAAIVVSESSELINAALDHLYDNQENDIPEDTVARMRRVAVQTAAMTVRFLEALPYYDGVLSDWVDGRPVNCRQVLSNP